MSLHTEAEPARSRETIGIQKIISDIGSEIGHLLHNTLRLFARESKDKVNYIIVNLTKIFLAIGIALIGIGFLLASLNTLVISLVEPELMARELARWLVPTLIGALTAIIGFALYKHGLKQVQNFDPKPNRTAESIERDKDWIMEKAKGNKK